MADRRMHWALGILAVALWAGAPYSSGQQPAKNRMHRQNHHASNRLNNKRGVPQVSRPAASLAETARTAGRIPESGTPTLERPGYTTLHTLPNQTLTPGATTVPGNAGGIAPASNDASSGEYTPSEGHSAPTTPGGNPSETQGVPTFSSAAQPADANLPRTLPPAEASRSASTHGRKPRLSPR